MRMAWVPDLYRHQRPERPARCAFVPAGGDPGRVRTIHRHGAPRLSRPRDGKLRNRRHLPQPDAILPPTGRPPGTTVTINGDGLQGTTSVLFGETPATNVQVVNDHTVTATAPPGTGTVQITLDGSYGTISGTDLLDYTYLSTKKGLSTTTGPSDGQNLILITGTGSTMPWRPISVGRSHPPLFPFGRRDVRVSAPGYRDSRRASDDGRRAHCPHAGGRVHL